MGRFIKFGWCSAEHQFTFSLNSVALPMMAKPFPGMPSRKRFRFLRNQAFTTRVVRKISAFGGQE